MFGPSPAPPPLPTPPEDPCVDCMRGHRHVETHKGSATFCDPIMAAVGMWARDRERQRSDYINRLIASIGERDKGQDS